MTPHVAKGPQVIGKYEELGMEMPRHERLVAFRNLYARAENADAEAELRREHLHNEPRRFPETPGPTETPKPPPADPHRHVPQAVEDDEIARAAFLDELCSRLVHHGAAFVRRSLRRMGFSPSDCKGLIREARTMLADGEIGVEVDEHRAVAIARYEDLYRLGREALDLGTCVAAQKQLDRITGVVQDDGAGALGDLAALALALTAGDETVERVLDAEYTVKDEKVTVNGRAHQPWIEDKELDPRPAGGGDGEL